MNNNHSSYVSGFIGGIMGSTLVGGILSLVLTTLPAKSAPVVVGYTEIGPDVCEIQFLGDDKQIYTFTEGCPE